MSIDSIKTEITALTPAEWGQIFSWVIGEERLRREAEPTRAQVIGELQEAGTLPAPAAVTTDQVDAGTTAPAWENPGTDHTKMYRQGAVVTHNGKAWQSITPVLNSWEPGTENGLTWAEYAPPAEAAEDPETGETITQWRPGIAVTAGMKLTYNGATYEVIQPHTTQADWLPDALPTLYKKL